MGVWGGKQGLQCGRLRLYVYYIMALDGMQFVHMSGHGGGQGLSCMRRHIPAISVCISVAIGACAYTRV